MNEKEQEEMKENEKEKEKVNLVRKPLHFLFCSVSFSFLIFVIFRFNQTLTCHINVFMGEFSTQVVKL